MRESHSNKKRKFYIVKYMPHKRSIGMKLLNEGELFSNGPPLIFSPPSLYERGFRTYPVTPIIHFSKRLGRKPSDIEQYGPYWLVSDRAKTIISQISSADFAFLELKTESDPGFIMDSYWLCDVITIIDSLNRQKSKIIIEKNDMEKDYIHLKSDTKIKFYDEAVEGHCAFRMISNLSTVICDDAFKETLKKSKVIGLSFQDITID